MLWTSDTFWTSWEEKVSCVRGLDGCRLCGETLGGVWFDAPSGGVGFDAPSGLAAWTSNGKEGKLELALCRGVGATCFLIEGASPEWPRNKGVELTCSWSLLDSGCPTCFPCVLLLGN